MDHPSNTAFIAPSLDELAPLFPAYEMRSFIAQGGMGAVYKARQKSLDRDVAIKILPREFGEDARFRASFESEAKSMARLNHPNLISVHDFGDVAGMLYIVMEFVQGKALFYSANRKVIAPEVALPLISALSRGLAHAHKGGIIHRDIKPANILLDTDATPKLGDFGLARPTGLGGTDKMIYGTPGYIAPEVYQLQPVDHRADIFSVGTLLSELLTGIRPTPGTALGPTGTDPRLDTIIRKATHPDPYQRYTTANLLADDLDNLLPKLTRPRLATAATLATALATATSPISTPLQSLPTKKKSPTLPVLAILALLLAIGTAAFIAINKKAPPTPALANPTEKPEPKKPEIKKPEPKPKKTNDRNNPRRDRNKDRIVKKPNPKPQPQAAPASKPKKKRGELIWESLHRLKERLNNGNFEELPIGTVKKNHSAYFIHPKAMTAIAAHTLADDFGASLAIARTRDDLDLIRTSFPNSPTVWLGASDAGLEGKWHWVDGKPVSKNLWSSGSPDNKTTNSQEGQDFVALTPNGLEDFDRTEKFRPVFEWRLKGQNPGSIIAQIKRTAKSIAAKTPPVFPATAFEFNGSRYLFYLEWTGNRQAQKIAGSSGGHLAVLSTKNEARHLANFMKKHLEIGKGCWFGGSRSADSPDTWTNPTKEIFTFHNWLPGEPGKGNGEEKNLEYRYLTDTKELGFKATAPRQSNKFMLIEWSHPTKRNLPKPPAPELDNNNNDLLQDLKEIRNKIRTRHGRSYRKFRRKHDEVIQDFLDDSISKVNNHKKISAPVKATLVEKLKEAKDRNELPPAFPPAFPRAAPVWLKMELKEARAEANTIKENYDEDFAEAKADYLDQLTLAATNASGKGSPKKAQLFSLEKKIIANDDKRFDQILDNKKVPLPEISPSEE